jgi:hypothetical protein
MNSVISVFVSIIMCINSLAVLANDNKNSSDPLAHKKLALLEGTVLISGLTKTDYYRPNMLNQVLEKAENLKDDYVKLGDNKRAYELDSTLIAPLKQVIQASEMLQKCHEADSSYQKAFQETILSPLSACHVESSDLEKSITPLLKTMSFNLQDTIVAREVSPADYDRIKEKLYHKQREIIMGNAMMAERMYYDPKDLNEKGFKSKIAGFSKVKHSSDDDLIKRLKSYPFPKAQERDQALQKLAKDVSTTASALFEEHSAYEESLKTKDAAQILFERSGEGIFDREYKTQEPFQLLLPKPDSPFEPMARYLNRNNPRISDPFFAPDPLTVKQDAIRIETMESNKRVNEQLTYFIAKINELQKAGKVTGNITFFDDVNQLALPNNVEKKNQLGLFSRIIDVANTNEEVDLRFVGQYEFEKLKDQATDREAFQKKYDEVKADIANGQVSPNKDYTFQVSQLNVKAIEDMEKYYDYMVELRLLELLKKNNGQIKVSDLRRIHTESIKHLPMERVQNDTMRVLRSQAQIARERLELQREKARSGDVALVLQAEERASAIKSFGTKKEYQVSDVKTLMKTSLDNLKELMGTIDEWYKDDSSQDFVENSLFFNPSLATSLMKDNPKDAYIICQMYQKALENKKLSKESREKWGRILMLTAGILVVAAIVLLTAGAALPLLAAGATGIGTIAATTGGIALKLGAVAGAAHIGWTAYDGRQLQQEANITKQHIQALGIGDEYEARKLMEEAMDRYVEATLMGVLTVATAGGPRIVMSGLRNIDDAGGVRNLIKGSKENFTNYVKNYHRLRGVPGEKALLVLTGAEKKSPEIAATVTEAVKKFSHSLKGKMPPKDIKRVTEVFENKLANLPATKFSLSADELVLTLSKVKPERLKAGAGGAEDTAKFISDAIKRARNQDEFTRSILILNDDKLWQRFVAYQKYMEPTTPRFFGYVFDDALKSSDDGLKIAHQRLNDLGTKARKQVIDNRKKAQGLERYNKNLNIKVDTLKPQEAKRVLTEIMDDYVLLAGVDDAAKFKQPMMLVLKDLDNAKSINDVKRVLDLHKVRGKSAQEVVKKVFKVDKVDDLPVAGMGMSERARLMKTNFMKNNQKLIDDMKEATKKNCHSFIDPKKLYQCVKAQATVAYNRFIANHPCLKNNSGWAFWSFFSSGWGMSMNAIAHKNKIFQNDRYELLGLLGNIDVSQSSVTEQEYFNLLREEVALGSASLSELQNLLSSQKMGQAIGVNKLTSVDEIYKESAEYIKKTYNPEGGSTINEFPAELLLHSVIWNRYWAELSCRINYGGQTKIGSRFDPNKVTLTTQGSWAQTKDFAVNRFGPIIMPGIIDSVAFNALRTSLIKLQDREIQPNAKESALDMSVIFVKDIVWDNAKWLVMAKVNGIILPGMAKNIGNSMDGVSRETKDQFTSVLTFGMQFTADQGVVANYNAAEYKYLSENLLFDVRQMVFSQIQGEMPSKEDITLAIVSAAFMEDGKKVAPEAEMLVRDVERKLLPLGLEIKDFYLVQGEDGKMMLSFNDEKLLKLIADREERILAHF